MPRNLVTFDWRDKFLLRYHQIVKMWAKYEYPPRSSMLLKKTYDWWRFTSWCFDLEYASEFVFVMLTAFSVLGLLQKLISSEYVMVTSYIDSHL